MKKGVRISINRSAGVRISINRSAGGGLAITARRKGAGRSERERERSVSYQEIFFSNCADRSAGEIAYVSMMRHRNVQPHVSIKWQR